MLLELLCDVPLKFLILRLTGTLPPPIILIWSFIGDLELKKIVGFVVGYLAYLVTILLVHRHYRCNACKLPIYRTFDEYGGGIGSFCDRCGASLKDVTYDSYKNDEQRKSQEA